MSPTTPTHGPIQRSDSPPPAPKGWYIDWTEDRQWRWWSGTTWTEHVHPRHPDAVERYLPAGATETRRVADLRGRLPAQCLLEHLASSNSDAASATESVEDLRSWYAGAVGERHVAWLLQQLGPEWTVLHSVPVGTDGSDIDHVLIGPPGVFTLNTKHHQAKSVWVAGNVVQINGQYQPYVRNALHEARRAQKLLSRASGLTVEMTGVIVLVGTRHLAIKQEPDASDVTIRVVRDSDLIGVLQLRRAYSEPQLQRIVAAAVRPQTWSGRPLIASDPTALLTAFASLEQRLSSKHVPHRSLRPRSAPLTPARSARPASPRGQISRRGKLWFELVRTAVLVGAAIIGLNYIAGNLGGAP